MPQKSHHVVPDRDGGWYVRKGGSSRATKHFDNKDDAVAYGRRVSDNQGSELFIHKRDGTIQRKDSYGKDPFPPRDKK